MSFTVPADVIDASESPLLEEFKNDRWSDRDVTIPAHKLTDDVLGAIRDAAEKVGNKSTRRSADAILAVRTGLDYDRKIPKLADAPEMVLAFLRDGIIKGWVWHKENDGHLYPWLVTNARYQEGRQLNSPPSLVIEMTAYGMTSRRDGNIGIIRHSLSLESEHVRNKTVAQILDENRYAWEGDELHAEYDEQTRNYKVLLKTGFAQQYEYSGTPTAESWGDDDHRRTRVVHDISRSEVPALSGFTESKLISGDLDNAEVPVQPRLRVFDLKAQEFLWVHAGDLTPHAYDEKIADKIVLPDSHRDLLDILTTDIDVFVGDVVDGKSAGNVILCKGGPGLGKTLSAEVYAEIIKRPLYSVHSGNLGTKADEIRKNLEVAFKRAKRWSAVLLLDEADVFVLQRHEDIQQNAIVAEFLRTLEYFDGLLFMTTNRPDDIDDAILSRAAAVISYETPTGDDAARTWQTLAAVNSVELPDGLVGQLVSHFPTASGRDMKMLLRLVLRVTKQHGEPVTLDAFRKCSQFRGIKFEDAA